MAKNENFPNKFNVVTTQTGIMGKYTSHTLSQEGKVIFNQIYHKDQYPFMDLNL